MKINQSTIIKGFKNGKEIEIVCSDIIMGSGDFLRVDNLEFAAPVIDEFIEMGGNTFDTARHYRHSETALGVWMKERDNRNNINILTKCCHPVRGALDIPRVNPEAIEEDLQESLRLLQTDHVEFLALHRDDETKPVGPIMEKLHEVVESGRVYAAGLSNWTLPRIKEAMAYCESHGLHQIAFNSPNLSLARVKIPRWPDCVSADEEMVAWHEETKLPLISWSSQAGGLFSGRFAPEVRDDEEMVAVYYSDDNWERYARAKKLAEEKGVSPIQVSLAFVLNQKFPTSAVIGSENREEMESSVAADNIKLTQDELDYLDLKSTSVTRSFS
jgi:aryl-alcohol dehydrogenase-like predicted oxidoreductase